MRKNSKFTITAAVFLILGMGIFEFYHYVGYGHVAPIGLHSDTIVRRGDIGIPSISKLYEAKLTNYGITPVTVTACDFVDDAGGHGKMVAYAIERWNPLLTEWETVVGYDSSNFCRPFPLGIVKAQLVSQRLWPSQSISTGEEATAARDGFKIGDKARFVVFGDDVGNRETAFSTAAFSIDEQITHDVPFRVRH